MNMDRSQEKEIGSTWLSNGTEFNKKISSIVTKVLEGLSPKPGEKVIRDLLIHGNEEVDHDSAVKDLIENLERVIGNPELIKGILDEYDKYGLEPFKLGPNLFEKAKKHNTKRQRKR
jgi:hypothetical protein